MNNRDTCIQLRFEIPLQIEHRGLPAKNLLWGVGKRSTSGWSIAGRSLQSKLPVDRRLRRRT
ncbi:MAG: hypothetical protein R3C05_07060 [Pirellulaceae bacterium]